MPEMLQTFQAMQKKEKDKRTFLASIQGINLEEGENEEAKSFDDIRRKALGINASADDIVSLQGAFAIESGFGIGEGLGYTTIDG
jgi:hypothetical protein